MGFDLMSLVPGSTLEGLIHDNADAITKAMMGGLNRIPHDPAIERPCITLMMSGDGDAAQLVALIGTTKMDGTPLRDITWFSLHDLLSTIPIAAWMRAGKEMSKEMERLEKQMAKAKVAEMPALAERANELQQRMAAAFHWPGVTDAPAFTQPPPAALPAPAQPATDDPDPATGDA